MDKPTSALQQYQMMHQNCHKEFMERYQLYFGGRRVEYHSSMSTSIYTAWDDFYEETMQSIIVITYTVDGVSDSVRPGSPPGPVSPLILVGRVKELIKEQSSINDINYIHIFKGRGRYAPDRISGWGKELDDNRSLHSYGYSGGAELHVYLWDPKNPPKIEEPVPSPSPAPSPSHAPVQRLTSSVIQATPLSEPDNGEINRLKTRVAELEERLKEIEHKFCETDPDRDRYIDRATERRGRGRDGTR